ncbi:MAG TPA: ATP-grasp domain-containing protein [Terriglobales bacterium]
MATARLAIAMAEAGFEVSALCPPAHPLRKANTVSRAYSYQGLTPLKSFTRAIEASKPVLVIPGDDLATCHLHELHRKTKQQAHGSAVCALIERSIGSPASYRLVGERATFIQIAQDEGIRAPRTAVISTDADLRRWISRTGLPVVLKANGSSGGDGVRIADTAEGAHRAFHKLQAPPLLARAAKRSLIDHDHSLMAPSLLRRGRVVNAQEFIDGREATSAVACWNGKVLAGLHFEVLEKISSLGHATVLRRIDHPEMSAAVAKIAQRLNLSGLYGFDFMLAAATGDAYLVEINPRTTQVGHLSMGEGRDLPAALFAAVNGQPSRPSARVIENDTVALFPQEWIRDAASPYLRSAYHDVPVQSPELVEACLRKARKQTGREQPPMPATFVPAKYRPSSENLEPLMAREIGSRYE